MPKHHPRRHRIESLVQEALAPMLAAALPAGIVTIRQVLLNKDFSTATVVYAVAGAEGSGDGASATQAAQTAQDTLTAQAWKYRRQLATSLNMRKTPQLVFEYDAEGLAADKMRVFLEKIADDG